jgi:hypothetical protein
MALVLGLFINEMQRPHLVELVYTSADGSTIFKKIQARVKFILILLGHQLWESQTLHPPPS